MFPSLPFSVSYFHFSQFSIPDTIQINESIKHLVHHSDISNIAHKAALCGETWFAASAAPASTYLGDLYAESGQTLQVSFSAVPKPNFASKYSLESSRRDLHNALLCTVL